MASMRTRSVGGSAQMPPTPADRPASRSASSYGSCCSARQNARIVLTSAPAWPNLIGDVPMALGPAILGGALGAAEHALRAARCSSGTSRRIGAGVVHVATLARARDPVTVGSRNHAEPR